MSAHRVNGREVGELVSAQLDGELDPVDETALRDHLRTCEECRRIELALTRADGVLRASVIANGTTQRESLRRVRNATARPSLVPALVRGGAVVGLAAALVIAAVALLPRASVANPAVPARETIASRIDQESVGSIALSIEQGTDMARPGMNIGVSALAELRLSSTASAGSAEVRFREAGQAYGILAMSTDITGASLLRLEGGFPAPTGPRSYEVWVHVEVAGTTVDTQPLFIELQPVPGGERARRSQP